MSDIECILPAALDWLAPLQCDGLVRIGGNADGGYVVHPRMVSEAEALVSMGIGPSWEFEKHFQALRPEAVIHAYDHTVSRRGFRKRFLLDGLAFVAGGTTFHNVRRKWSVARDFERFFGTQATHFAERVHDRSGPCDATIASALQRVEGRRVLLKIDIEGAEYRVIGDVTRSSADIVGLIVEFHDTDHLRPVFVRDAQRLLERFDLIHLHANNWSRVAADGLPEVLEATFVPRGWLTSDSRRSALPLPLLDYPNRPDAPDYQLRFGATTRRQS